MEELIEKFAIRIALGNNGGEWSTHYTEAQKYFWRDIVRDLIDDLDEHRDPWPVEDGRPIVITDAEEYISEFKFD
jgi:hypothetical protein